jgi:hypothetical protein
MSQVDIESSLNTSSEIKIIENKELEYKESPRALTINDLTKGSGFNTVKICPKHFELMRDSPITLGCKENTNIYQFFDKHINGNCRTCIERVINALLSKKIIALEDLEKLSGNIDDILDKFKKFSESFITDKPKDKNLYNAVWLGKWEHAL